MTANASIIMDENISITYPYYFYPKAPCAGYHETELYNKELLRLFNSIQNFNYERNVLFHLTIGAAAEEFDIEEKCVEYQWQQLCPIHIRNSLKNGIKVIHWIVTPNHYFGGYGGDSPYFTKYCKDIGIRKVNNNTFTSDMYDYTCIIFNTMMPTIDTRNSEGVEHIKMLMSKTSISINPEKYKQTPTDINFTKQFYTNLKTMTDEICERGGISTCFSFAVFNMSTCNSHICNYKMFPLVKTAFCGNTKLLCEWMFSVGCYCVYLNVSDDEEMLSICYVEPQIGLSDGNVIVITNGTFLTIDFVPASLLITQKKSNDLYLHKFVKRKDNIKCNIEIINRIITEDIFNSFNKDKKTRKRKRIHSLHHNNEENRYYHSSYSKCIHKATKFLTGTERFFENTDKMIVIKMIMVFISFCTDKVVTFHSNNNNFSIVHNGVKKSTGNIEITVKDKIILIKE